MNKFKENWFKVLVTLILIMGIFFIFFFKNNTSDNNTEVSKVFSGNDVSSATQITCTYPQMLSASYINEITHTLNKPETHPMIFTFSKLDDPKVGQLSYLDSTQSITNVPIYKISDDKEKVIYIDGTGENYLSTHTIYKKFGVSVYTKTVSLLGTPFGTLATGSCVGY